MKPQDRTNGRQDDALSHTTVITGAIVFLSASLLFLVQPLTARLLLPHLGGSSQVWNTVMIFFQSTLLAAYLYAYLSVRLLGQRWQKLLHLVLLFLATSFLPMGFSVHLSASEQVSPVFRLLGILAAATGLPVFLLSASSPLFQHWLALGDSEDSEDPYFLYSAGNAGSLLALLAYPFLVAPFLTLGRQRLLWSAAYLLFVLLTIAFLVKAKARGLPVPETSNPDRPGPNARQVPPDGERPGAGLVTRWLLLSFVPSSLMLAVTSHMSSELPSIPLIWIIPLSLYLLSFILGFMKGAPVSHRLVDILLPLAVATTAIIIFVPTRTIAFSAHLAAFFLGALMCHRQLARSRPATFFLTEFYLWIALGGVCGGLFNGIAAPHLFDFVAEYPIALVALCLLRPQVESLYPQERELAVDIAAPALLLLTLTAVIRLLPDEWNERAVMARLGILFVAAAWALVYRARRIRFALSIAAVLAGGYMSFQSDHCLLKARSYYGVYRVARSPDGLLNALFHGSTIHGCQNRRPADRKEPLYCFHKKSPVALIMTSPAAEKMKTAAVIGLGVGTLAAYGRRGQFFSFFELDETVKFIALDSGLFSYIADSEADCSVFVGDGRLLLSRRHKACFDLIVLDAFNSDAVPIHLLTREAFLVYLDKLAENGAIAANVSNRHLCFFPLFSAIVRQLDLYGLYRTEPSLSPEDERRGLSASSWIIISRTCNQMKHWINDRSGWSDISTVKPSRLWTDDYANLLGLVDW